MPYVNEEKYIAELDARVPDPAMRRYAMAAYQQSIEGEFIQFGKYKGKCLPDAVKMDPRYWNYMLSLTEWVEDSRNHDFVARVRQYLEDLI